MASVMIEDLAKKYEMSEAEIERVLGMSLEFSANRLANGNAISGSNITAHRGHVFGVCRSVRSSISLGAGARFMKATYKLALMDLIAEAKALGANAIINMAISTSQGDNYYVTVTGDAVQVEAD